MHGAYNIKFSDLYSGDHWLESPLEGGYSDQIFLLTSGGSAWMKPKIWSLPFSSKPLQNHYSLNTL